MSSSKADKLTALTLSVFQLNGQLIEWGNGFCQPYGLTSARWQVLGAIALARQSLSAPQIGSTMGITRQGVQKQINLLIQEGLVELRPNPGHKRSPFYVLTIEGQSIYQTMQDLWTDHVQRLANQFTSVQLNTAAQVLAALSGIYANSGVLVHDD